MTRRTLVRRGGIAAGIALGAGALAGFTATASAAPVQVQVGSFTGQASLLNDFYPGHLVIHRGTKVKFHINGFHTVTFPKKGTKLAPLIAAGPGLNPATADPAGAPYWWGGTTPALGFNPIVPGPSGGRVVTGARTVNSGFPNGPHPSFTVSFPKPGVYQVRCYLHPRMRGTVIVLPRAARHVDTAKKAAAKAAREMARDSKNATKLLRVALRRKAGPVWVGPATPRIDILGMFPKNVNVATGGSLTFTMRPGSEIHTVSFGPPAFLEAVSKSTFEGSGLGLDPQGALPSDPPAAGPPAVTPTSHGNGYVNSGILPPTGTPGTHRFTVTFPTAGVYRYICLVHTNMVGTVTVG
jgi:plastocyanin